MATVKTECQVTAYEIEGEDCTDPGAVVVKSHWNQADMIVVQIAGGSYVTVAACDLILAAKRCSNA